MFGLYICIYTDRFFMLAFKNELVVGLGFFAKIW